MTDGFAPGAVRVGASLGKAAGAVVLLHGRGADAEDMLPLAEALAQPDLAFVAPRAPGRSWYPLSFLAPLAENEPALGRALAMIGQTVEGLARAGLPLERILLLGFSQGACLALEYAARNARRYGGVAALSGGLIGSEGTPRDYAGTLSGTPVFLGCGDRDGHIPLWRIHESTRVLRDLGAEVTERIYPGMGHTGNADEIGRLRALLARIAGAGVDSATG
jgi:phospholipase/carboxylesterase